MSICPNCGAKLINSKFLKVCEYCGSILDCGNDGVNRKENLSLPIIKRHYKYLQNKANSISSSRFVSVNITGRKYTVVSSPFYSNDGILSKLIQPYWMLKYQNNGKDESLWFGISANRPASRMALNIDGSIFNLVLHQQENRTAWFILPMEVFLALCRSKEVDISTDIKTDKKTQYNELPIFACRFYNATFDQTKFLYSINVRMITDN